MKHFKELLLSAAVNFLLFISVIGFLKPLLNSGDDAIVMYTFSGSFNVAPSALVDYAYGWHFLLGTVLTNLFFWFPAVNWYTAFLLALHFSACTFLLHFFLKRTSFVFAIAGFFVFALFFEVVYLLSLNYTNTAIVCSMAGNVVLVHCCTNERASKKHLLTAFTLLLISGLLRLHAWAFVEVFFLPFLFNVKNADAFRFIVCKVLLSVLLFVLFFVHINY